MYYIFTALFDDMLCTAVSCTAKYDNGKGEALLDMADGPSDIGDRVNLQLIKK